MANIPGTNVAAPIVPFTTEDHTHSTEDIYLKGGHRVVSTITQRNDIFPERRKEGMLCSVVTDGKTYQLRGGIDNIHWSDFADSGTHTYLVTGESQMLALASARAGDFAIHSGGKVFLLRQTPASEVSHWQELLTTESASGVTSVNNRSGSVTLTSSDVGLANVDNTADTDKPVSIAQGQAITAVQIGLDSHIGDTNKHKAFFFGTIIGTEGNTSYPVTHGLGTERIAVSFLDTSETKQKPIFIDWEITSPDSIEIKPDVGLLVGRIITVIIHS